MVNEAVDNIVQDIMDDFVVEGLRPEHWNIQGLRENLKRVFVRGDAQGALDRIVEACGAEPFKRFARMILLEATDSLWKDHLLAIDRLRQGVGLRGYGQRNPLLEYKREALQMYQQMSAMRDEVVVTRVFTTPAEVVQAAAGAEGKGTARRLQQGTFRPAQGVAEAAQRALAGPAAEPEPAPAPESYRTPEPGEEARMFAFQLQVRRNDPCPCASGKKYKKCCFEEGWLPPGVTAEQFAAIEQGAEPVPGAAIPVVAAAAAAADEAPAPSAPEPLLSSLGGDELPDFLRDAYAPPEPSEGEGSPFDYDPPEAPPDLDDDSDESETPLAAPARPADPVSAGSVDPGSADPGSEDQDAPTDEGQLPRA
jgi:hypothetical protein